MKKILILSMYCNEEFFIKEEELCKSTWAKDIIDGKYTNINFFAYTASADGKYHISYKDHIIQIPCDDGLLGTAEKTIKCLKFIEYLGIPYDYIIRTNTSSYINVKLFDLLIQSLYNTDAICAGTIFSSNDRSGPYVGCPHARGNSLTLPHSVISNILDKNMMNIAFDMEKSNDINNAICTIKDAIYTIDDNFIAFVYNSYLIYNKKNVFDYYMTFGDFGVHNPITYDCVSHAAVITFRIYDYSFDKEIKDRYYEFKTCETIHHFISNADINMSMIHEYINDNLINYSCSEPNSDMTVYNWLPKPHFLQHIMPTYNIPYTT